MVLIWLPPSDQRDFSAEYFLSPFPVFRIVAAVILVLWGCGFVLRELESHDIKHLIVLEINPRCRVEANFFFARAAALTSCWILVFGMYVVDYKWEFVQTRRSFHYVLYPIALLGITFIGMI